MRGCLLRNGEGVVINFRGTKMTIKVSGEDSGDKYSMIEMVHPPNVGPVSHIHPRATEAYYVLEGEYFITHANQTHHAQKGDFILIPKGVPHNYKSGRNGGKVLVISPAGLEQYFLEVATALKVGHVAWELEQEIARRCGQEFLDNLKHWGQ